MKKSELIHALASRADLSRAQASKVVDALFSVDAGIVSEALRGGDTVKITGFGSFELRQKEARRGRNPRTGKEISIASSSQPVFRGGKGLKGSLGPRDDDGPRGPRPGKWPGPVP